MRGWTIFGHDADMQALRDRDEAKARAEHLQEKNSELMLRNIEVSKANVELAKANLELTREMVRLSQRSVPVLDQGTIEDPPTTAEADNMVAVRRGERSQTPAPGPTRGEN